MFSIFLSESNTIQKPVEVVIQDESRLNELGYCPGTTSRNVEWNWTKPGETAILPCPLGKYIIHRLSYRVSIFRYSNINIVYVQVEFDNIW